MGVAVVRDEAETVLRAWHAYEIRRGGSPVIDFDCHPVDVDIAPAESRLEVYRRLSELRECTDEECLVGRLDADIAYLGALLGERKPLPEYIQVTQGCGAAGWSPDYVLARGEQAREALAELGSEAKKRQSVIESVV